MSRHYRFRLQDILDCCAAISAYTQGMDQGAFVRDRKTYDACVRNIEIIGEAARNIPLDIQQGFPEIEWPAIIAMRNLVVHAYFGLSDDLVWNAVVNDIPALSARIKQLLERLKDSSL